MIESESDGYHEFTPTLVVRLVKALRACGRPQEAIDRAQQGLERFPGFTDLVFEQGTAALALGRESEAIAYFERCIEMGDAPSRYTAILGCGTYLPKLTLAELRLNHGDVQAARELLHDTLEQHPGFFGTILPYATALLRSGIEPDEVVAEIERRVTQASPTVRFMLGTALYECGAVQPAERQFRLVLESQPSSAPARIALGEALLSQKRYAEAAAEASKLPESDPLAVIACRTELFGRIAGGDLRTAPAAAQRAARAGLPPIEQRVFDGWLALASEQQPPPLPAAGTPLLGVILEALLRVHDFTTFEVLLPLLLQSELARREQRELLASLYLRRGFLASAAEEWMAVCQTQPDCRALIGLSRVAAAHGLPEDAAVFAGEALKLEPANTTARALLARYEQPAAA
jgi:tetratricopeptide (TPR) repeat protein